MLLFFLDKYAISNYHLSLLKTYELLDFVDFPFLTVDISPAGKKYLNYFVTHENEFEHRLLIEISPSKLNLLKQGLISVKQAFEEIESGVIFSILVNQERKIERVFQLPIEEFISKSPIPSDYFIEINENFEVSHLTAYHAKYFSYELTKKTTPDSVDKLASALVDAQVELNPHQVDAALFAFHSPLSKGVLLADEVGLGKTIEAGLVISQKWAERKRRILVIVPSNLRKQWNQELQDKFFLSSLILETKSFNAETKNSNFNPFDQSNKIIICSYHFAKSKESFIKSIDWDLVVIDEAHRLRNVYKASNKIANIIKNAISHVQKKILLTATPLQNSLLELYGLVSIIDEYTFGDMNSFKSQYGHVEDGKAAYQELKNRLAPISKRTLRKHVAPYISYTKRISITERFEPTNEEQRLYELVSDYLQSPKLYALPASQRQLMILILRRLLASSTFAISGTLWALSEKLQGFVNTQGSLELPEEEISANYDNYEVEKDEWEGDEDDNEQSKKQKPYSSEELVQVKQEIESLKEFARLAESIRENSKGVKLMTALQKGFDRTTGNRKALIFTESTRTQIYLRDILEQSEFKGKILLFNGSNNDDKSKEIYRNWLERNKGTDRVTGSKTADIRAALVEYFRDEAEIMIATEAAAEGINLQFCSLVVNYDLPWNPQRIEQRIGRCHRYGQKNDVVVVNFLNVKNAADLRVYELLENKFKLFDGVFGASDEVLGTIGSGIDFEKRIVQIYQTCRSTAEIETAFNDLQRQLESEISEEVKRARINLLENFDESVLEKLKVESANSLSKYESWLWNITSYFLHDFAEFENDSRSFTLKTNPFNDARINEGVYKLAKNVENGNTYRLGHPLVEQIINVCKGLNLPTKELVFKYTGKPKISILEQIVGQSGWLIGCNFIVRSFEETNYILLAAICDDGTILESEYCHRLFSLQAAETEVNFPFEERKEEILTLLHANIKRSKNEIVSSLDKKDRFYFADEMDKLDKWAEDRRNSLRLTIKELDREISSLKKESRLAPNMPEKLKLEKQRKEKEVKRDLHVKEYERAAREIESQKDELIDTIEKRMYQGTEEQHLFTFRWRLI